MGLIQVPKKPSGRIASCGAGSDGIALFIVLAAVALLSVLITEFTYIAQINQRIAYDAQDQLKVHYLAKSALKLSLLRLKVYQNVKTLSASMGGGGNPGAAPAGGAGGGKGLVPKQLLDKIWSFPFVYPIPANLPGLTPGQRDSISKFQKDSSLEGNFQAFIESESAKYNLNLILAPFAPKAPSSSPSPTPASRVGYGNQPSPSPTPGFNPDDARQSLAQYFTDILNQKFEHDTDFADGYREFKIEELMYNIYAWADRTYQRPTSGNTDYVPLKQAPFYSVTELHMISPITDELYNLFTPTLTVQPTPGINVNTMTEFTLRALIPGLTQIEVDEFFKYRDSQDEDNNFTNQDDFFKYLTKNTQAYNTSQATDGLKSNLTKRNIRLVTDETQFKITVRANQNQATRVIEAWVTLGPAPPNQGSTQSGMVLPTPKPNPVAGQGGADTTGGGNANPDDPGLKITYMRII